ncbi:MAG: MinD/ParA family protein [Burkholderiales bacterium]
MSKPLRSSRIVAVTSGKGGVGKTFVAANLAAALAQAGRRVLVMDADLGLANLDIVLGLVPGATLHEVLMGAAALDDVILEAPGGFSVLPAGSGLMEYSRLTGELGERLREVLTELGGRYDYLLLDTGAGIADIVLYITSLADEILIVTTPEPTAMADAYATIKVLAAQQRRTTLHMVLNQLGRNGEGHTLVTQLQQVVDRFLNTAEGPPVKLSFLGEIPADPAVVQAIRKRRLLLEHAPASAVARALTGIARTLDRLPCLTRAA